MKRSTVQKVMLAMMAALALVAIGCNDDDDPAGPTGNVSMQVTTASGAVLQASPDAQIFVQWSYLALVDEQGEQTVLINSPDADPVDITASPILGPYEVPEGTYTGIVHTMEDVYVIDGPDGERRCDDTNVETEPLPVEEELTIQGGLLQVAEDGSQTLLVTMPVIGGACETDGGEGVIEFNDPDNPEVVVTIVG
jgi:hypothetical protein